MRLRWSGALVALVALAAVLAAVPASGKTSADAKATYIVQMKLNPVVAYEGGVAGLKATKPAKGQKIDPDSADVQAYVSHLKSTHDRALEKVGGGEKLYDYAYTFNGVAARLTPEQVDRLEKSPDVLAVTPQEEVTMDTSSTPGFLGLTDPNGLWDQLGGPTGGKSKDGTGAGENIVIGDIDSGIWPEGKSFSDRDANGKLVYSQLQGWKAKCSPETEQWDANLCNKKLISARYFNAAWGGDAGINADRPWEFASPRDYHGHGTHTASTAGGNNGIQTTGAAANFGAISGIAPRARIAVYKALWSTQDASEASGRTGDLVAAIDQAVADGVDVINYSISGTTTNFADPVELAFLFAADAGIFVSESAGNNGPTTGTVAHPSPWTTTVAAGTHNRNGIGSVTLGNGVTYNGASVATPVASSPLIDSTAAGVQAPPGSTPEEITAHATKVALCYGAADNQGKPVLDPAKVAGKIVLCDRGVTARVNKSVAVQEAGGVGMIMVNTSPNSINADFHFVPTVHLNGCVQTSAGPPPVVDCSERDALKAYAAAPGATARINASTLTYADPAPFTASFSSRGPLAAGGGDILKPDVIAPGQDILAAVAPPGNHGFTFNLLSGTSMSAPHVSGLAALLKQAHPTWTPLAVKSALMTSAGDVRDGSNTNATVIFRQGAGHVRPNSATNPGLVYDSGFNDWLAFLCGTTSAVSPSACTSLKNAGYSTDASDMNVPSIAIGDLAGTQTVTRKVKNVGSTAATYTAAVTGLTGVTATVNPASVTIAPGETKTFTVAFERATAALNAYVGGQLTWSDGAGGHNVRIPVVIRPVPLATPAEVTSNGSPVNWQVRTGYAGTFGATVRGLVAATKTPWTITQDPDQTFDPTVATGTFSFEVSVAANSLFRTGIYEDAIAPTGTDLDMFVYNGTTRVGASADGDSNEQVTLRPTADVTYKVYIHGYNTNGPSATGTLFTWVVPNVNNGNTTLSGITSPSTTGGVQTHTATFSGLAAGTRYLGQVDYSDGSATVGRTILTVRTP
jgi:subtilisin family serine protease